MSAELKVGDRTPWNRCDVCGTFIPLSSFATGAARRVLLTPDSDRSREEYETLCARHNNPSFRLSDLTRVDDND